MADIYINGGGGVNGNLTGEASYVTTIAEDMGIVPGETGVSEDPRRAAFPMGSVGLQFTNPNFSTWLHNTVKLPEVSPRTGSVLVNVMQVPPLRYDEVRANNTLVSLTFTSRRFLKAEGADHPSPITSVNAIGPELGLVVGRTGVKGKFPDPYGFEEPTDGKAVGWATGVWGGYGIEHTIVNEEGSNRFARLLARSLGVDGLWASAGLTIPIPPAAWGDATPTVGYFSFMAGASFGLREVNINNRVARKDKDSDDPKPTAWYKDKDQDGYGDVMQSMTTDTQPIGYVDNPHDCNDNDAAINSAAQEVPDNKVDENCNNDLEK